MCGIAGIISQKKTNFDITHFNILGMLNDERGGDSCGIFIDGNLQYGINKTSLFRDFTLNIKYPTQASIALLHCRKASPGYIVNLSQAQPIIIKNNNNIEFVLMHNGTITNIKSLALKYIPNIKTEQLSDSQILAQIIYEKGYNVLNEYEGSAALVMIDYRKSSPDILIFKGSSCYNTTGVDYEKPLYYMVYNNKFYFSSIYYSLYCIYPSNNIYNVPCNKVYKIKNNKLYLVQNIDRNKLTKSYNTAIYTLPNTNPIISYSEKYLHYDKNIGKYLIHNSPANGEIVVYPSGYIVQNNSQDSLPGLNKFYFIDGRLLYNKNCYDFLQEISDYFEKDLILELCPEIIDYFAYGPRIMNNQMLTVDQNFNYIPYLNGSYITLFIDSDEMTVKNGIVSKTYIYPLTAIQKFYNYTKAIYFNFEELESSIMKIITKRITNDNIQ